MKKLFCVVLTLAILMMGGTAIMAEESGKSVLYYQGHGSFRITTAEGKVIYVDPHAGDGYDLAADLILVSHGHYDHTAVNLITNRNPGCREIWYNEALVNGEYKTFDLGFATVEAVQAGNNPNHNIKECVGWLITLPGDISAYATGDTSTTDQMAELAERDIHYGLYVCDGIYNMDLSEASTCAKTVNARHSIPYHMAPGKLFDLSRAEAFDGPGKIIVSPGEEITLE